MCMLCSTSREPWGGAAAFFIPWGGAELCQHVINCGMRGGVHSTIHVHSGGLNFVKSDPMNE